MTKQTIQSQQDAYSPSYDNGDEIDLKELVIVLWNKKLWIAAITSVITVIALVVALMLPNIYRSEALLTVQKDSSSGLGGAMASQLGGIASLAGISLDSGDSDKNAVAIELVQSLKFFSDFIQTHPVLPDLMAIDTYNPSSQTVVYDEDIYDASNKKWVRDVSPPKQLQPSPQESHKKFKKIFSVNVDKNTAFVRFSVEHQSPIVAKQWVDWLVQDINRYMLEQEAKEAQESIDYLKTQLEETKMAALEEIFYSLIEEQTKVIMLSKVRSEYLFKTLDPAVVSELKNSPKRSLISVLGFMLGFMMSILLVLILHYTKAT